MFRQDGQENIPHREWLFMFETVINEAKDDMKKKGQEDEIIGAKV